MPRRRSRGLVHERQGIMKTFRVTSQDHSMDDVEGVRFEFLSGGSLIIYDENDRAVAAFAHWTKVVDVTGENE